MNYRSRLERQGPTAWAVLGCSIAVLVGVADYWTAPEALAFYLIPIVLAARFGGRTSGAIVSVFSVLAWIAVDEAERVGPHPHAAYLSLWSGVTRVLVFSGFSWILSGMIASHREAETMKEYLVHDLRSPLTSTVSGLETIRELALERDDALEIEIADLGIVGSRRVLTLIDAILDTGRLSKGQMPVQYMQVSPSEMVEHAIRQVSLWGDSNSVAIENDCDPGGAKVVADPLLVERVIVNLLGNAIKYSPPMSIVHARASVVDSNVEITIEDDGPGMTEGAAKAVFARYSQVGGKDKAKGTGLGLTFCRLAVEAQGGKIWLDSELGKGTKVSFTLPVAHQRA